MAITVATGGVAHAEQFQPSIVSDNPVSWTPHVVDTDGRIDAIAQVGNTIIAGGKFTAVTQVRDGTPIPRTNIFSFNATTGLIDPNFAPVLNQRVLSIQPTGDGTSVYIAGAFTSVNGVSRKRIARVDVATGNLITSFKANPDNWVRDMEVANGKLYVAGSFTTMGGVAAQGLAALNATTGALLPDINFTFTDPRTGEPRVQKIAITPDGQRMVAIGNFTKVSGVSRGQIAMFDLTTNPVTLANWATNVYPQLVNGSSWCSSFYDTYMTDVDFSPDGSWFAVAATGAYRANRMCDTTARWETNAVGTDLQPTWVDWTGGDSTTQIAVTGTAVYAGGHQRWENNPYAGDKAGPGAVSREGLAALDPINGVPFTWDPTRNRGHGVFAFLATDAGLWIGSDTDRVHNEYHSRIAFMPLAGGVTPPTNTPYTLPNDLYRLSGSAMDRRSYNGSSFGSASTVPTGVDWSNVRGVFALQGRLYMGWSDGHFYTRTFDGTNVGPAEDVSLNGLDVQPPTSFLIPGTTLRIPPLNQQLANATGMFYYQGRLYYTVANDPRLYYRYFNTESRVIGANIFVASGNTDGFSWSGVRGMTIASGNLYFGSSNGNLSRVAFTNGAPTGPITVVAGPQIDGSNWNSAGMFLFAQTQDSFPPSVPGTPSGTSTQTGTIDLSWAASSDNASSTITYHVYRDGGANPIASFDSASTTTVSFSDTGLAGGSSHTYRVSASDADGNTSALSPASASITVKSPDLTPPTVPGTPSGTAAGKTAIDLTWAASTDDESTTITYRIYRDGNSTPVGSVSSSSTTTVSFTDTDLTAGSTHTYQVDAVDGSDNASDKSAASAQVTTAAVFFTDAFDSGTFSAWTSAVGMSIDQSAGGVNPPSAAASASGTAAYLRYLLPTTRTSACLSENLRITSQGANGVDLMRFRTASGGAIAKVFLSSGGVLYVRSDFAATQKSSVTALPSGWNNVELCGSVGATSTWDLYLNGVKIVDAWVADTGSTPIGRIDVGDVGAKIWSGNVDDVVLDEVAG